MLRSSIWLIVAAICQGAVLPAAAITFDFEDVPLGTKYGATAGNSPGDVVLTKGGAKLSVENFSTGLSVAFNIAQVANLTFPTGINNSRLLAISNINTKFDFTSMPTDVTAVRLFFVDFGGKENFNINGAGLQVVNSLSSLGPSTGFDVHVSTTPNCCGVSGTLEVTALPGNAIDSLLIGGQEFYLDDVSITATLPGDYNGNGIVDAADFVVWRDNNNTNVVLPNDSTPGSVADGDYDVWRAHFGQTAASGATTHVEFANAAVPEPASELLFITAVSLVSLLGRRIVAV